MEIYKEFSYKIKMNKTYRTNLLKRKPAMFNLSAMILGENIVWQSGSPPSELRDAEEGVRISFSLSYLSKPFSRRESLKYVERVIRKNDVHWLKTTNKVWVIDLDRLKEFIPDLNFYKWLKGQTSVEPEFETGQSDVFGKTRYQCGVVLYITPEEMRNTNMMDSPIPPAIIEGLEKFRQDYPDSRKVAFIMMEFGKTPAHEKIANSIKEILAENGIRGIRADDKEYHDDLFYNVLTYLYGVGFGVAVFERIETESFNPNVSFEIGYMMALNKPICLLKDRTMKALHTDLTGKLHVEFDPQNPSSMANEIKRWLSNKGFIVG